jgi:hypothetical protein
MGRTHTVLFSVREDAVDERAKRVGRNEVLLREVNERLRELGEDFSLVAEESEFVCECATSSCVERVRMPLSTYEEIRSDPKRFIVAEGHELPEFEKIVDRGSGYLVVEKLPGGPAGYAIREDPRD